MAIYTFTQVKGGNGTTTLAANLAYQWPKPNRILVELGITGGSLAQMMGFDIAAPSSPKNMVEEGYDLAYEGELTRLSSLDKKEWLLPALPAPAIPDFPHPGEKMWWQSRVDLATQTDMDVICDLGLVAPEHLIIHNRILNASIVIVAVAKNSFEAKAAVKRLARYRDRLAVVIISKLRSLPVEITEEVGCECLAVLPYDDAIADSTWRNILVSPSKAKPVREYLAMVSELGEKLGGDD